MESNILKNVVILMPNISLWTGRKKLSPEDLKLASGDSLPPHKLASLGSKKVMDPEALAPFAKFKGQALKACLSIGTRFLGGYAIPIGKIHELMAELSHIESKFKEAKVKFLSEYDGAVAEWKRENPGWESIITRSVESLQYVESQLQFSVQTFHINPVEGFEDGLEREIGCLADQLRREIQQQARAAWDSSYAGKVEVGQKAVRPIMSMLEKIEGLTFLEPRLRELVGGIRATVSSLPEKGVIKGADFAALCGVMHLLGQIPEAKHIAENPLAELMEMEEEINESTIMAKEANTASQTTTKIPSYKKGSEQVALWF